MNDSELTKMITGLAIVMLSLARHMERHEAIPEGSTFEELQRRLTRLPLSLQGTPAEEVLRLSISWLQKDQEGAEQTPPFDSLH